MSKIYYERPQHLRHREENKISKQTQANGEYYQPSYQPKDYSEKETITPLKHGIKEWITNGILIVLSIGLVINICVAISVIGDMNYSYEKKEESFWYDIEQGRYAGLISDTWDNRFSDVKETEVSNSAMRLQNILKRQHCIKRLIIQVMRKEKKNMQKSWKKNLIISMTSCILQKKSMRNWELNSKAVCLDRMCFV